MILPAGVKAEAGTPERGVDLKRKRSDELDGCSTNREQCEMEASFQESKRQALGCLDISGQYVHQPVLAFDSDRQRAGFSQEVKVPIGDGRTQAYCDWWRAEAGRDDLSLHAVRLIGDAGSPEVYTTMAQTDLAYFSEWGRSRVVAQQSTSAPFHLVLPVLTRADVVQQAVAGVLSGQIGLSLSSVEAVLVLANAVGFVSLEMTCEEYLKHHAEHMRAHELLRLAQLADHLGLPTVLDTAANRLIRLPWHNNMQILSTLLSLSAFARDTDKRNTLLHHPERGACTELQVLAVLEDMSISRADCAPSLEMYQLQPAELQALFALLANSEEDSGSLYRAAAQQLLIPENLRPSTGWTKNARVLHNMMMPVEGSKKQYFALPGCNFRLCVRRTRLIGKDLCGVYVCPSHKKDDLCNVAHHFTLFALQPAKPYANAFKRLDFSDNFGCNNYLNDVQKLYTPDYPGPFTIGVWWQ